MKKALIFLFLISVLLLGVLVTTYFIVLSLPSNNKEQVTVVIKTGDSVEQIATQLKEQQLIKSKFVLKAYLFIHNKAGKIQPGEYEFKQSNMQKIVAKITQPPEIKQEITLTLLEGWTAQDMAQYLEKQGVAYKNEFLELAQTTDTRSIITDKNYKYLSDKPITAGLEGFLFPDTYRVFEDIKTEEIIEKMLDNFDNQLTDEMIAEISKQDMKVYEVITLASIVEKEARTKDDKKTVAGIFLNRLEIGQKLESDATVNYITGKNTDRPTYNDIDVDDLFNTYKFSGLPPGPICNPGMDSILAVIYPEPSDYLYFINTPGGVEIEFSETYEQHLEKKEKYYGDE